MRATRKAILKDVRTGLLGNRCEQGMEQIPDARNLHPEGDPSNHWEISSDTYTSFKK